MKDFIEEWNAIRGGIEKDGGNVEISIGSFLCDAPVTAFMKNIVGHTGYNACERCIVWGKWRKGRVVCNDVIENPLKDATDFSRKMWYAPAGFITLTWNKNKLH